MNLTDTQPWTGRLRKRREALGLSRQQLAHEANCSLSYLASLEAGATPTGSSAVLERALRVLDHLERVRVRDSGGVG